MVYEVSQKPTRLSTIKKFFIHFLLFLLGAGIFTLSLFLEKNYSTLEAAKRKSQVTIISSSISTSKGISSDVFSKEDNIVINRSGTIINSKMGDFLKMGDIVETGNETITLGFSEYGELRLGPETKVSLEFQGEMENSEFAFRLHSGKVWLNTLYSDAEINLLGSGFVLIPQHAAMYINSSDGKSLIYSNTHNGELNLVPLNYIADKVLTMRNKSVINTLILPQGTQATVYEDKIKNNQETLRKLLYSKLVKELQYGVFDRSQLRADTWLTSNLASDQVLLAKVQKEVLGEIRSHGLKYPSFDSVNYNFDQFLAKLYQELIFSEEKLKNRVLEELFVYLYDSEYLYDVGRAGEGKERLQYFQGQSLILLQQYDNSFQEHYLRKLRLEYERLTFVKPGDALFDIKMTIFDLLEKYSSGQSEELAIKFEFLNDNLNVLYFIAEKGDANLFKTYFDRYVVKLKELVESPITKLDKNIYLFQQQNQLLDNLFKQFPILYKDAFFTAKLLIENEYLDLLPDTADKNEEKQTIVSQRIDFLKILQEFFLDGAVSLPDTIKIVFRLNREIDNIVLPQDLQLAVADLFRERLKDFAMFYRFLNSPEYVNSPMRGKTRRERFMKFIEDQKDTVTIDEVIQEIKSQNGDNPDGSSNSNLLPVSNNNVVQDSEDTIKNNTQDNTQENVQDGNGDSTIDNVISTPDKVPVKRVKRS